MSIFGLIEYADASPEVRAIYDDIMTTRKTDWINNFWKAIAHDPVLLKRTWEDIKQIMAPGALDPLTKEMIYVAVSVTNQCEYCIASHTASAQKQRHDRRPVQRIDVRGRNGERNQSPGRRIPGGSRRSLQDTPRASRVSPCVEGVLTRKAQEQSSAPGKFYNRWARFRNQ